MATFTNMATLTYNGNTVNSNVVTGQLQEALAATKTAVRNSYSAGEDITYVVSILNNGAAAYSDLTLTDNLGAYPLGENLVYPLRYADGSVRCYVNGTLQSAPTVTAGPPMVISGISVPAGGNVLIVYEAIVNRFAPLGEAGSIVNQVEITGNGLLNPVSAQETVTARRGAEVTITKALSPMVVSENGQLTYTFTINNTGNEAVTAADNAVLNDSFDPILQNLTVTLNGSSLQEGTDYTYDTTSGLFSTVAGRLTVPAASFAQNADGTWTVTPGSGTLIVSGTV